MNFKALILSIVAIFFVSCKNDTKKIDTATSGAISIDVDESVFQITEDLQLVFQNIYNANINLQSKSLAEISNDLVQQKSKVAVIAGKLNYEIARDLKAKKCFPKTTLFAKDAVAIFTQSSNDTLLSIERLKKIIYGQDAQYKGVVFDNINSSVTKYMFDAFGVKADPKTSYSLKTSNDVIKFIASNKGYVGLIGVNWITQPKTECIDYINKVKLMAIKSSDGKYYQPTQDAIASNQYPLARDLYIVNCQSYDGLGLGFSAFVAGEDGQRVILKSGLVPVRFPGRKIVIQNKN